ncbi:MAG: hypothetical protein DRG11_05245 [Epsilonproteobacteria bacterium]|nr:MAG: hypothetical protein DRG11_05245 [Campylobacterota bacterium]
MQTDLCHRPRWICGHDKQPKRHTQKQVNALHTTSQRQNQIIQNRLYRYNLNIELIFKFIWIQYKKGYT